MREVDETKLTDRQRYWLDHLNACEAAGKTLVEYASDQGIKVASLYAAKNILVGKGVLQGGQADRFQRVHVVDSVAGNEWRIQLPNGVSVVFSGAVDSYALTAVLNAVMSVG